jgi:hypothetical protein
MLPRGVRHGRRARAQALPGLFLLGSLGDEPVRRRRLEGEAAIYRARVQTSTSAIAIAIGLGRNRAAPNIIYQTDFKAHKQTQKTGKGGGRDHRLHLFRTFVLSLGWGPERHRQDLEGPEQGDRLHQARLHVHRRQQSPEPLGLPDDQPSERGARLSRPRADVRAELRPRPVEHASAAQLRGKSGRSTTRRQAARATRIRRSASTTLLNSNLRRARRLPDAARRAVLDRRRHDHRRRRLPDLLQGHGLRHVAAARQPGAVHADPRSLDDDLQHRAMLDRLQPLFRAARTRHGHRQRRHLPARQHARVRADRRQWRLHLLGRRRPGPLGASASPSCPNIGSFEIRTARTVQCRAAPWDDQG